MIVRVKKGRVTQFADSGSLPDQIKNLAALIRAIQRHATELQTVAAEALSVDPSLISLNRSLQHQVKTLQNTLSIAEKQIKRKEEKQHV